MVFQIKIPVATPQSIGFSIGFGNAQSHIRLVCMNDLVKQFPDVGITIF
jgi:hypothetical protein